MQSIENKGIGENSLRFQADQPAIYTITVRGRLDIDWSEWFGGMSVITSNDETGGTVTTLSGSVADQSALHGLLRRIADLGLMLLQVTSIGSAK